MGRLGMDLKKERQRNNKMMDSCTDQKVNAQVDADLASAGVNRTWKGDGKNSGYCYSVQEKEKRRLCIGQYCCRQ
jgi:hypothetical protein